MKIHGDSNSGNCLKVKYACDALALPYSWIEIDTMKGGSRTPEFLMLNPWGQVPTVEFDDGRTLAQSNAIIRYLARGGDLIPADDFAAVQMDAWLFLEQYSHEPYVAVCRFQMIYLGNPPSSSGEARLCGARRHGAASSPVAIPGRRYFFSRGYFAAGLYARRA
jgi:glutathione S-transferase